MQQEVMSTRRPMQKNSLFLCIGADISFSGIYYSAGSVIFFSLDTLNSFTKNAINAFIAYCTAALDLILVEMRC
jgi:hypothetical protein